MRRALRHGRNQEAASCHLQALDLFRELGDRSGEAEARNGLGRVFLANGQADRARIEHAAALALASQIGDAYERAGATTASPAAMTPSVTPPMPVATGRKPSRSTPASDAQERVRSVPG